MTERPEWMAEGACVGIAEADLFFPDPHSFDTRLAKRICFGCYVREECLEYALETRQQYGIFGGYTAEERKGKHRPRKTEPGQHGGQRDGSGRKPKESA